MTQLQELRYNIAASLWHQPGTFDELCKRDFLMYISQYGVSLALQELERERIIYYTGKGEYEKIHVYKSAVPLLNKFGYDIN